MFCLHCGTQATGALARFCKTCGAPLVGGDHGPQASSDVAGGPTPNHDGMAEGRGARIALMLSCAAAIVAVAFGMGYMVVARLLNG